MAKYEFIDFYVADDSANVPVVDRCRWPPVSTSGFDHWRSRPQSATSKRRDALAEQVRVFFDAAHGTYGYRRIHADLRAVGVEFAGVGPLDRARTRTRSVSASSVS